MTEEDLKRYPLIEPVERLEFQAFRWGLVTGFVFGFGIALVVSAWVFA